MSLMLLKRIFRRGNCKRLTMLPFVPFAGSGYGFLRAFIERSRNEPYFCNYLRLVKIFIIISIPIFLQCSGCTSTGAIEEKEWWGSVTFIGDEVHYAVVKYYQKYTTGTSPTEYNGETLENKSFVYIKNARTGESKKIFETSGAIANFLPNLKDTTICFVGGGEGHVYKYTGALVTTFKGSGIMGGWTVPYSKYVTNERGRDLVERDWAADSTVFIDYTDYCSAQPWGILNAAAGAFLIRNGIKLKYSTITPHGFGDQWINISQMIKFTALSVYDSNYVIIYDFDTYVLDTLYNLGRGSNAYATVNSNATLLIRNNLEIIDLTLHKYKKT